jgi:hypothetical protein
MGGQQAGGRQQHGHHEDQARSHRETSGETDTHVRHDYLLKRLMTLSGYVRSDLDVERCG